MEFVALICNAIGRCDKQRRVIRLEEKFARMVLVGCGLIGGSLALAVKKNGLVGEIIGVDERQETLQVALARGVIDQATNLVSAIQGADLIVLAVPVRAMTGILKQVAAHEDELADTAILTDVGGTKYDIVTIAEGLLKRAEFIGGHPMAGSEKSGIYAAHDRLLENAVYVLTPTKNTNEDKLNRLSQLLKSAGARPKIMDAAHHDQVVAAISHVPHLIAAAMVNQVSQLAEADNSFSELAAGGFRDITRIASSDPHLWRDLSLDNRQEILPLIENWIGRLELIKDWLSLQQAPPLEQLFRQARVFRDSLPVKASGSFPALFSMTINVPDEPGIIGIIASLLGRHAISIRNIGILESREGEEGQLILQFDHSIELEAAEAVLKEHGYTVYERT